MGFEVISGQGGWLREVSGPDERGRLGEVRTGADALRSAGVPVESAQLPALREMPPDEPGPMRDELGKFA